MTTVFFGPRKSCPILLIFHLTIILIVNVARGYPGLYLCSHSHNSAAIITHFTCEGTDAQRGSQVTWNQTQVCSPDLSSSCWLLSSRSSVHFSECRQAQTLCYQSSVYTWCCMSFEAWNVVIDLLRQWLGPRPYIFEAAWLSHSTPTKSGCSLAQNLLRLYMTFSLTSPARRTSTQNSVMGCFRVRERIYQVLC